MRHYRAHGLTLLSEFPLEGYAPAAPEATPDAEIRVGPVPSGLRGLQPLPYGGARPGLFLLEGGGRFLVEEGRRVTMEVGDDEDLARLFLTGPATAALLVQRGELVLHGNAVVVEERAVVLCGPPGAGKSAGAAALHALGARLLADDVTTIRFQREPRVSPGFGPLKVRRPGLPQGASSEGWAPVRADAERVALPFDPGSEPVRLEAVYLLGGQGSEAARLRGRRLAEASPLLLYRPELAAALGRAGDNLVGLGALSRGARVVELPAGSPEAVARAVRADLGASAPGTVRGPGFTGEGAPEP